MIDAGYFARGSSVLRRVHEERAVGLFLGRGARGSCQGAWPYPEAGEGRGLPCMHG